MLKYLSAKASGIPASRTTRFLAMWFSHGSSIQPPSRPRIMSFTDTSPYRRPFSQTGRPEMRLSRRMRCASRIVALRGIDMTCRFITSRTLKRCSSSMMISLESPPRAFASSGVLASISSSFVCWPWRITGEYSLMSVAPGISRALQRERRRAASRRRRTSQAGSRRAESRGRSRP